VEALQLVAWKQPVSLAATYWGSLPELVEELELARLGHLRAHVERFSLADAPRAYEALSAGEVVGRAVVVPAGRAPDRATVMGSGGAAPGGWP
jgi:D-arabinose 1-dehydrogenase-like Zn-dependent alcohol dehydrogenase